MNLKKTTILAIFALTYIFCLRIIGTLIPAIFRNPHLVKIAGILSLLATLTIVFFYIFFYKDYVLPGQSNLQKATILAIIGSSIVFLREIKNVSAVFNLYILQHQIWTCHIDAFAPWVNSLFVLIFFITLYAEMPHEEKIKLKRAVFFAILGTSIMTLLRTILLSNYLYFGKFTWFITHSQEIAFIFFPLFIFGFVTVLYFLIAFYKEQTLNEGGIDV